MAKFQTVIKQARFVYSPFTAMEMQGFPWHDNAYTGRLLSHQKIFCRVPMYPVGTESLEGIKGGGCIKVLDGHRIPYATDLRGPFEVPSRTE
jgi:hypothetical protein